MPTESDLEKLRSHFDPAQAAMAEIRWRDGYPVYPRAIEDLMKYLGTSPWVDRNYKPAETEAIFSALSEASLDQVRRLLTGILRQERFCDGAWQNWLQSGRMEAVVNRAAELLNS